MFEARSEPLVGGATKVRVHWQGAPVSIGSALQRCRDDEAFRRQLMGELAGSPLAAYFWETPPISASTLEQPFEFVLTEARALAQASPEIGAFDEHFPRDDGAGVVAFQNLGGDATLVVPCPRTSADAYV